LRVIDLPLRDDRAPGAEEVVLLVHHHVAAPTTQHLPQPRATTAACEVRPPRE
jgi:hypothetical protein